MHRLDFVRTGEICRQLFRYRRKQPWPPTVVKNEKWAEIYSVQEVGPYPEQIGQKAITKAKEPITNIAEPITKTQEPITICWCPENENALSGSRKDLRERAKVIWEHLVKNPDLTVRELSLMLRYSLAATQGAINALKECGLLVKIGQTKGSKWIVKTLASDTEVIG